MFIIWTFHTYISVCCILAQRKVCALTEFEWHKLCLVGDHHIPPHCLICQNACWICWSCCHGSLSFPPNFHIEEENPQRQYPSKDNVTMAFADVSSVSKENLQGSGGDPFPSRVWDFLGSCWVRSLSSIAMVLHIYTHWFPYTCKHDIVLQQITTESGCKFYLPKGNLSIHPTKIAQLQRRIWYPCKS